MSKFDLIKCYSEITKNCPIAKIGEHINFYQADELKTSILARNCYEIDMISAFPNLCRYLFFESDPDFIIELTNIENKLERNIFLTNYLKNKEKIDNINYLVELNNYAKILTLSYIYNNFDNVNILEFKKDGAIFSGSTSHIKNSGLHNFNTQHNFRYNSTFIPLYCRYNKTSFYNYGENKIVLKGLFKDPPKYFDSIFKFLINGEIYSEQLQQLPSIYSKRFLNILAYANLYEDMRFYYGFGQNKYLNSFGKLESVSFGPNLANIIEPFLTIKLVVYPLLALLRIEK
jgi:hypothetical protein